MPIYHVTTETAARAILRDGFRPTIGPRAAALETAPATYFFNTEADLESASWNWLSEAFEDVDEPLIVLVVAVPSELVHIDPAAGYEATVKVPIPPEAVVRAYDIDTREDVTAALRR